VKVSLRSPAMLPWLTVVDPELTYSLPPEITASSGLDALTQLIEPFVSIKANPITDAICREGIGHAARSLRRAYENGADQEARQGMSLASLFGGLALANAALGARIRRSFGRDVTCTSRRPLCTFTTFCYEG
jgi:alcohol dehydrogenase class IV